MNMDTNPFSTGPGGAAGFGGGSAFGGQSSFGTGGGGGSAFGSPHPQQQQQQQQYHHKSNNLNAGNSPFVFQNKTLSSSTPNQFGNATGNQGFHQHQGQDQSMAFDPHAGSGRGRGRGRGSNNNYRGGRGGGTGTGGRGGANMTYVAPGLNQGPSTQPHPQDALGFASGPATGDDPMSFNVGGNYQGSSGNSNRGRGGGRGGRGGAPGQYRSLQWRADGSHMQPQQPQQQQSIGFNQSPSGAVNDASMEAHSQGSITFNAFGNQGQPALSTTQSAFNSNPSGFTSQSSSQFSGSTSMTSAFTSGGGPTNAFYTGSAFGNPMGAGAGTGGGLGAPSAFTEKRPAESIFVAPAIISGPKSVPVTSSSGSSGLSSKENTSEPPDAESRLARFNAVPVGNRYDELKEKRVREREEAIRQGTIPDPNKPRRLEDAITFVGTCMDMCPEYERHEREYQQSLEKFEKIPGTDSVNHAFAVKAFARPAAGAEQPLPSDVRPPQVLLKSLDYLMTEIVSEGDLSDSHSFVRDRTRSIRQDFTLQNSRGIEAIHAHEIIARYHIMCMHQLCENEGFSAQQEMEQLQKVLTSLQEFYDDMRVEGTPCPNEAEFRAYHVLSHLRDPDMMRQAQLLPAPIFQDPYIQVASEMHALTRRNNDIRRRAKIQSEASPNFFSRFFKMITGPAVTYLMACIMETHFVEIRKGALKAMNKSYLDQHGGVLVNDLIQILGFDDSEECLLNCQQYDLELSQQGQPAIVFGRKDQVTRRRVFKESSSALRQHRNLRIVEAKRTNYSTADIVFGRTPKPHETQGKRQSIATPSMGSIYRGPTTSVDRMGTGLVSASASARLAPAVGIPSPAVSGISAFSPASQASSTPSRPVPSGPFNFGVGQLPAPAAPSATSALSLPGASVGVAVAGASAFAGSMGAASMGLWTGSGLNPAATPFQPAAPNGLSFKSPVPSTTTASTPPLAAATTPIPSNLVQQSAIPLPGPSPTIPQVSQPIPAFTLKAPEKEGSDANPFAFNAGKPTSTPPLFTLPPLSAATTEAASKTATPSISISTGPSPGSVIARPLPFATPTPQSPIVPKSDATRVVSKRGRVYPRTVVEAVMEEFLNREIDRMTRATVAQLSQEVAKERTLQRAEERRQRISIESTVLASKVLESVVEEMIEEIQAELYRERKLQVWVITRWKEYTIRCRRRADELKRRQEHFLAEVKAMGSRAGLGENPMATRIRDYKAKQQRISSGAQRAAGAGTVEGVRSMVETVMNKRKRMLSIGQEGSLDEALMEGLKRAAAPKREMWAPLPVYKIVASHYRHRRDLSLSRPGQQHPGSGLDSNSEAGTALVKRRWRLFVNTPTFKGMGSKWLLTKLGVDMGRQTKSQQRSGAMVAVHHGSDDNLDVVIHGVEDRSVVDLLGMSKYSIMETAAFMFEFSKVTLSDRDATEEAIRQYWLGERERLIRFLACFPKVKQPLVFIMWTTGPEIWERMSPRVVEFLELDEMVASEKGPLRSYRFLVMDLSMMKLDPYVTGSLEWLASETRDFFEDPATLLKDLLDKYQPILDWGLCRISLAEAPFYSQFNEDEDGDLHMIQVRRRLQEQQKKMLTLANGATKPLTELMPRSLFVESVETGFNLAVRIFNQELESLARTIEVKGQGDTREGAAQEGRVKDAMARFIRQAELKEMKRGSIQDRINYGMDPKSAFCDYMDVFIATMGGLAKEHKNIEAKTAMRTEIWEMLTTSKEDRVPLEAAFKRITSQVLTWVQDGILDAKRFNVRLMKWNEQRQNLLQQQQQYRQHQSLQDIQTRGTFGDSADRSQEGLDDGNESFADTEEEPQEGQEHTFRPMLIDDDIDVEGIVFEYEMMVQTEIRAWEKKVEQMVRDLEESATLVPTELESSGMTTSGLRFGGSRKRRAPERPRNALKKTRLVGATRFGRNGSVIETSKEETPEAKDEDLNLFMSTKTTNGGAVSFKEWAVTLQNNASPNDPVCSAEGSPEKKLTGVAALSQLVRSLTPTLTPLTATTTMASPSRALTSSIFTGNTFTSGSKMTTPILKPTPVLGQPSVGTNASSGSNSGDRLARLRSLIKDVKASTLLTQLPSQQQQ